MISVSFLKSKYPRKKTISLIEDSEADLIHVDLMDGKYVKECNYPLDDIINDLKKTTKLLDVHFMVKEPLNDIKKVVESLNVWSITFHLDATKKPKEIINYLKMNNIKVGIALNPSDKTNIIDDYSNLIDYVLIMGVNPGLGGQKFIPEVLNKVNPLKEKNLLIGLDGGVNADSIKMIKEYNLDIIVSGSYVCLGNDYNEKIRSLKNV